MVSALRPENCDVLWEFGCGESVLHCEVEVQGGYGFCLWVFGSG
jgi:precorrin-6B methylase 2